MLSIDLSFVVDAIKEQLGIPPTRTEPPLVEDFLTVTVGEDSDTSDLNGFHIGDFESALEVDSRYLPMLSLDIARQSTVSMERGRGFASVKCPAFTFEWILYYVMLKQSDKTKAGPLRNPYFLAFARADAIRAKLSQDIRWGTLGKEKQIAFSEVLPPTFDNEMHQILTESNAMWMAVAIPITFVIVLNEVT